jgi:hypothetical protein
MNAILLNRAKRAIEAAKTQTNIKYKMGHGGYHPDSDQCSEDGLCDCSGFVAWTISMNRDLTATHKNERFGMDWIETTNIYNDAIGPQKLFMKIAAPQVGSIAVYPDHDGKQGHTGLVVNLKPFIVVDCRSRYGRAITSNNGSAFTKNPKTIFVILKEDNR